MPQTKIEFTLIFKPCHTIFTFTWAGISHFPLASLGLSFLSLLPALIC